MAHNLNEVNGKVAFMAVKEKAWHGLGQIVENAPTSEEAIKLAGMDWEVKKEELYLITGEKVENNWGLVRQDTKHTFCTVGNRYTPLQNAQAFDFFDSIVGAKEAIYETAGALGKGEVIFITAKLPSSIVVGKNDLIDQYLLFTNPHDGRGALEAMFTPIRVVCNNTLTMAMGTGNNSQRIRIHHGKDVYEQVKQAHKLMGIVGNLKTQMEESFNAMAKKGIVDKQLKEFIMRTFETPEYLNRLANMEKSEDHKKAYMRSKETLETLVDQVFQYAMENDTQQMDTTRGTLYGAYNSITGYFQNVKEYKDEEQRFSSIYAGGGAAEFTVKAYNQAVALLKTAPGRGPGGKFVSQN